MINQLDELQQEDADGRAPSGTRVGFRNCLTFFFIWVFLISCLPLFVVNVFYLEDFPPESQWLSFLRMILFGAVYIGTAYVVGRGIWSDLRWKEIIFRGVLIVLFDVGAILGTVMIKNPGLRASCCGDSLYSYWGWAFPVLGCYGREFCGFQQADVRWWGIIMNVIFFSSLWIVVNKLLDNLRSKHSIF